MVLAAGSFSKEVLIVLAAAMFIWWLFNIEILSFYNYDFEVALESGFVVFLILFLWSYLRTVFSDPGWTETDIKMLTEEIKRTCDLCKNSQPDRCQHCTLCNKCVLGMDHHNRWFNNCIGYRNKKYYILSLFYAMVGLVDILVCSLPVLYDAKHFFRNAAFWLALFAGLIFIARKTLFALTLVSLNITQWEYNQAEKDGNARPISLYNKGPLMNAYEVFGRKLLVWWLPIVGGSPPTTDGLYWSTVM